MGASQSQEYSRSQRYFIADESSPQLSDRSRRGQSSCSSLTSDAQAKLTCGGNAGRVSVGPVKNLKRPYQMKSSISAKRSTSVPPNIFEKSSLCGVKRRKSVLNSRSDKSLTIGCLSSSSNSPVLTEKMIVEPMQLKFVDESVKCVKSYTPGYSPVSLQDFYNTVQSSSTGMNHLQKYLQNSSHFVNILKMKHIRSNENRRSFLSRISLNCPPTAGCAQYNRSDTYDNNGVLNGAERLERSKASGSWITNVKHRLTNSVKGNSSSKLAEISHADDSAFITSHRFPQTGSNSGKQKLKLGKRKSTDKHAKIFRELIENWSVRDLHCLVVEYEAALAVKDLQLRADAVRHAATSLREDFSALFNNGWCADITVVYKGVEFAAHRSLLINRSPLFHQLLTSGALKRITVPQITVKSLLYNQNRRLSIWCQENLQTNSPTTSGHTTAAEEIISPDVFNQFLRHLYTGAHDSEFFTENDTVSSSEPQSATVFWLNKFRSANSSACATDFANFDCLSLFSNNSLEYDVQTMLTDIEKDVHSADAVLLFLPLPQAVDRIQMLRDPNYSWRAAANATMPNSYRGINMQQDEAYLQSSRLSSESYDCSQKFASLKPNVIKQRYCEFRCHSAVLAARSKFFRNLIQKRLKGIQSSSSSPLCSSFSSQQNSPKLGLADGERIEIILDESVIPRQYVPLILHAFYTDVVDLSLIIPGCNANMNSLSEVQAIASGKSLGSPLDEVIEIYQIANFLEFSRLAQGCEDIIASLLTIDNLPAVWTWATESGGSNWIKRRCIHLLSAQFSVVISSSLLFDLDEQLLIECLKSDFVQASELDILTAVIRWGEHQLVRRIEEREPNLLSGTTHSVSRKGVRRTDLSDEELKGILMNLLPLVRSDFVLPHDHSFLVQAWNRGLIIPPLDNNETAAAVGDSLVRDIRWVHTLQLTRPRMFLPYFQEAKDLLRHRLMENPEQKGNLLRHYPPFGTESCAANVPDALCMAGTSVYCSSSSLTSADDSSTQLSEISLPDAEVMRLVELQIEHILRTSNTVKRGLACGCIYHKQKVFKQVTIRVLREYNLPDILSLIIYRNRSEFKTANHCETSDDCCCNTFLLRDETTAKAFDENVVMQSCYQEMDLIKNTDSARSTLSHVERLHEMQTCSSSEYCCHDDFMNYDDQNCHVSNYRRYSSEPKLPMCNTLSSSSSNEWPEVMAQCSQIREPLTNGTASHNELPVWSSLSVTTEFEIDNSFAEADLSSTNNANYFSNTANCSKEATTSSINESKTAKDCQFKQITENIYNLSLKAADCNVGADMADSLAELSPDQDVYCSRRVIISDLSFIDSADSTLL